MVEMICIKCPVSGPGHVTVTVMVLLLVSNVKCPLCHNLAQFICTMNNDNRSTVGKIQPKLKKDK